MIILCTVSGRAYPIFIMTLIRPFPSVSLLPCEIGVFQPIFFIWLQDIKLVLTRSPSAPTTFPQYIMTAAATVTPIPIGVAAALSGTTPTRTCRSRRDRLLPRSP